MADAGQQPSDAGGEGGPAGRQGDQANPPVPDQEETQSAGEQQSAQSGTAAGESEAAQPVTGTPQGTQQTWVVKPGDCLSSIAVQVGLLWETIWNDSANSELKALRKDPNVLMPGDVVCIPEKKKKEEPGQTEVRHRFQRKGEPSILRLQIKDNDEPVANQPYELKVDDQTYTGTTDPEGKMEIRIRGNSRRGRLTVGVEPDQFEYQLALGGVDPVETTKGVQQRLNNLGYNCGPVDGLIGPKTRAALRGFQKNNEIAETGEADGATRGKLQEKHGC